MLKKIFFHLQYLGKPPWDTGVSPPELIKFIEQHPPGRALDLGCGTGTNVITLAQHGWLASGVDFASKAVLKGQQKARQAGMKVDLRVADVSKRLPFESPFDLILDIGCLHSLPISTRAGYYSNLVRLLAKGGHYLLYAFIGTGDKQPGISPQEIHFLSEQLQLQERQDSKDTATDRESSWLIFKL